MQTAMRPRCCFVPVSSSLAFSRSLFQPSHTRVAHFFGPTASFMPHGLVTPRQSSCFSPTAPIPTHRTIDATPRSIWRLKSEQPRCTSGCASSHSPQHALALRGVECRNHRDVIRALIQSGARVDLHNCDQRVCLDVAPPDIQASVGVFIHRCTETFAQKCVALNVLWSRSRRERYRVRLHGCGSLVSGLSTDRRAHLKALFDALDEGRRVPARQPPLG